MNDRNAWILKPAVAPENVRRLEDHSAAYEHPDWLPQASFLWASSRRAPIRRVDLPGDPLEQLKELIAVLDKHGHELIGVDITAADVSKYGLKVVRAIIPGLQPLGFAQRIRLGGRRLYEAPVRMGYHRAPAREEDLNRVPHCFP
jgi:ribosomal protein S12 methylthiotransferase accessory factor